MKILYLFRLYFVMISVFFIAEAQARHYKYEIGICAIFRDEAPYLKEWIEFHKLVGVEHFYLYNNLSIDDYLSVLQPYINSGEVELTQWLFAADSASRWYEIQTGAYNDALKKSIHKCKWLALLDTDEFLFPSEKANLNKVLKEYEQFGGVCVNWQLFGSSDIWEIPSNKLMIETLVMGAETLYGENLNIKSIVRPKCVEYAPSPHFCIYKSGFYQVTENKQQFYESLPPSISVNKIRINHYWSRNKNFLMRKKMIRRNQLGDSDQDSIDRDHRINVVEHTEILRFVPKLRKRMGY